MEKLRTRFVVDSIHLHKSAHIHMPSVFRQQLGLAIGGSRSAQEASVVLMRKELPLQPRPLPPILRYRDNFVVLCWQAPKPGELPANLVEVEGFLRDRLKMGFKVENCQPILPLLGCEPGLDATGVSKVGLKLPVFVTQPGLGNPSSVQRRVEVYSPNAHSTLQSYVPRHRSTWGMCLRIATPLPSKQYPGLWWRPRMLTHADFIGKRTEVLTALKFVSPCA